MIKHYSRCAEFKFLSPALLLLFACAGSQTTDPKIDAINDIFRSEGITATLVVATAGEDTVYVYNNSRSAMRFSPASTFKIPNTLIALDTRMVTSKDSIFTWDGTDKGLPRWNKNQTLESAFKVSCVWCYQEMARKIGAERYGTALADIDYGNRSIGSQIDRFWLNGDLQISAREQIEFLKKLYHYELPFRREHIDILKDIMLVEQTNTHSLYAKSGWAATTPQVAWYVGFVTKSDETWLFAMNMQVDRPEQTLLREELTIRSLQALGIIQQLK